MENLKQLQQDFVAYMMARDFTPDAVPTPELDRAMNAAAAIAVGVIVLMFLL